MRSKAAGQNKRMNASLPGKGGSKHPVRKRKGVAASKPPASPVRRAPGLLPWLFIACFATGLGGAVIAGRLPLAVPVLHALASIVTFIVYAFDKSAAVRRTRRTPENTLHLLALLGGWPGALAAQRLLRHKSSKASFQAVFWFTVFVNCGLLAWLALSDGANPLFQSTLQNR